MFFLEFSSSTPFLLPPLSHFLILESSDIQTTSLPKFPPGTRSCSPLPLPLHFVPFSDSKEIHAPFPPRLFPSPLFPPFPHSYFSSLSSSLFPPTLSPSLIPRKSMHLFLPNPLPAVAARFEFLMPAKTAMHILFPSCHLHQHHHHHRHRFLNVLIIMTHHSLTMRNTVCLYICPLKVDYPATGTKVCDKVLVTTVQTQQMNLWLTSTFSMLWSCSSGAVSQPMRSMMIKEDFNWATVLVGWIKISLNKMILPKWLNVI